MVIYVVAEFLERLNRLGGTSATPWQEALTVRAFFDRRVWIRHAYRPELLLLWVSASGKKGELETIREVKEATMGNGGCE